MKKIVNLALIFDNEKVLLAMKKRRYGAGKWNGYGGKLEPGETVEESLVREVREESGLRVKDFDKIGLVTYVSDVEDDPMEVHVYKIIKYEGEPVETEEMTPKWFKYSEIPFDDMWLGDRELFPLFYGGKKIVANYHFIDDDNIKSREVCEVDEIK